MSSLNTEEEFRAWYLTEDLTTTATWKVPADIQLKFAKTENETIRRKLASNISLLPETGLILADDPSLAVVQKVAGNRYIDPVVLVKLAKESTNADILETIVCRNGLTSPVISALIENPVVIQSFRVTPRYFAWIVKNEQTTPEMLEFLWKQLQTFPSDDAHVVRIGFAESLKTPVSVLKGLWADNKPGVRETILRTNIRAGKTVPVEWLAEALEGPRWSLSVVACDYLNVVNFSTEEYYKLLSLLTGEEEGTLPQVGSKYLKDFVKNLMRTSLSDVALNMLNELQKQGSKW